MTSPIRTPHPDVTALWHMTNEHWIERGENQQFFTTAKRWELWDVKPLLRRVAYWNQTSILFAQMEE